MFEMVDHCGCVLLDSQTLLVKLAPTWVVRCAIVTDEVQIAHKLCERGVSAFAQFALHRGKVHWPAIPKNQRQNDAMTNHFLITRFGTWIKPIEALNTYVTYRVIRSR